MSDPVTFEEIIRIENGCRKAITNFYHMLGIRSFAGMEEGDFPDDVADAIQRHAYLAGGCIASLLCDRLGS